MEEKDWVSLKEGLKTDLEAMFTSNRVPNILFAPIKNSNFNSFKF